MRRALPVLLVCAALAPAPVHAARKHNDLLRVSSPPARGTVRAHPFVNVIVTFGQAGNGAAADPSTFRARLGRADVTDTFVPLEENGQIVGMHGTIGPSVLRLGPRRLNRLRLHVLAQRGRGRSRPRDIDRVRFRAVEAENQPPVAHLVAPSDVILPLIGLTFDGTHSQDPDLDRLTYRWEFGDGAGSDQPKPTHTFGGATVDATVRLTVDDGQLSSSEAVTLYAVPPLSPGRTPGIFRVEAAETLEFGAVPPGASDARTLTLRNLDATPTSEVRVRFGLQGTGFALDASEISIGPEQSVPVTLTFAPGGEGHQGAEIVAVAAAANARAAHLLAHGFGGTAPETGPTLAGEPVFYNSFSSGVVGIFPSGARFVTGTTVRECVVPQQGAGTGDFCLTDADCRPNGGSCPTTGVCRSGERAGQPCTVAADCPRGVCPADVLFDPEDMCADGQGNLYLLSVEGSFTDPNPGENEELAAHVLKLTVDANGTRTGAEMLARTTAGTTQIACDGINPGAGGQLYLAQFREFVGPEQCFRDSRESLLAMRKTNGTSTVLLPRIDAAEGLPECEDYDPVTDLRVTRDGAAVFASLPEGGLYRIRPTALRILQDFDDAFQVHPDGSLVIVTSRDEGLTGLIQVFRMTPEQALNGAPRLSDLTPCATIKVANNRDSSGPAQGATFVLSYAAGRATPGSLDATVLASFVTPAGPALSTELRNRGTFAVAAPAGTTQCTVLGLISLDQFDQLSF
jgi:hypothetical protein